MVHMQDSENPTGVSSDTEHHNATRARERKANAAVQLRLAGATWEEIAETLGYPTPRTAIVATEKALEAQLANSEDREQMRRLAGARLDRLLRAIWAKAIDPQHPDQMGAISKAREIIDRHAKLFGLDAPTEVVVHSPTMTELESWVAKVVAVGAPPVVEYDILDATEVEEEPHALPAGP
jgi:hypothetical protein